MRGGEAVKSTKMMDMGVSEIKHFVVVVVFFSSRRRHTRYWRDWSSDVCSSDLMVPIFKKKEDAMQ